MRLWKYLMSNSFIGQVIRAGRAGGVITSSSSRRRCASRMNLMYWLVRVFSSL